MNSNLIKSTTMKFLFNTIKLIKSIQNNFIARKPSSTYIQRKLYINGPYFMNAAKFQYLIIKIFTKHYKITYTNMH